MARADDREIHPYIPKLVTQLEARRVDRREFLRTSTLLGLSAASAYSIAGRVLGDAAVPRARAQGAPRQGGVLKISQRVPDLKNPHTYSWVYDSNCARQVNEYLTRTGTDNITRPWLLESWETSDDLKTWTLNLRPGVTWSNGDPLVADHVIWNLERMLDPDVGSSMLSLMESFLLTTEGGKARLWDANAIEKVDDRTIRLNGRIAQLAVPENLFHYPALMLHPEDDGEWGPGAIGTGPFTCEEVQVGKNAIFKARRGGYWGTGPHLDEIHFIDTGDDPFAEVAALKSRQVHGQFEAKIVQFEVLNQMEHLTRHEAVTAQTGVVRMRVDQPPFDDPRVRQAVRKALDTRKLLQIGHIGIGAPGEHHHVCTIHPDYADIGFMEQDLEGARALLAQAGHENGVDVELTVPNNPQWEQITVQACAQMWSEVGINCAINLVPESQYWEIWTKVPLGFTRWTHRPLGFMVPALAYRSGGAWNETGYANPEFDDLLSQAEATLDLDERKEIMARLEQILLDDGPVALPLWRGLFSFWDNRVQGFEHHPTSYIFGQEIWLDEA